MMTRRGQDEEFSDATMWLFVFLLILLGVAWCTPATAEPLYVSQAALAAGQASDVAATFAAFDRGCSESNPLLGGRDASKAQVLVTKAATTAAVLVLTHVLDHSGHGKAARIINYIGAGSGFTGAVLSSQCNYGLQLVRRQK